MRLLFLLLLAGAAGQSLAQPSAKQKEARELRCLALNIYFEARSEPIEGQLAVAFVTMNRVMSPRYPESVCEVVWQKRQFSWTHDGKSDTPAEQHAWAKAREIARFMLTRYLGLPARIRRIVDRTNGALHYYAPKLADPYWARAKEVTLSIGGHIFLADQRS